MFETGITSPQGGSLQENNGHIYWVDRSTAGAHTIKRVPFVGGSVETVASDSDIQAYALGDAGAVFYTALTNGNTRNHALREAAGTSTSRTLTSADDSGPSLGVRSAFVYWAGPDEVSQVRVSNGMRTSVSPFIGGVQSSILVGPAALFWIQYGCSLDCSYTLVRHDTNGYAELHKGANNVNSTGLAMNADTLFFATSQRSVLSVPRNAPANSTATVLVPSGGLQDLWCFGADSTHVYWLVSGAEESVMRLSLNGGGTPQVFARMAPNNSSTPVAMGADHIYALQGDGTLVRYAK